MIWRSTAMIVAAFVTAGLAVWYGAALLDPLGLGEFAFLGQLGLPILVLSILEALFSRLGPTPSGIPRRSP
jgi:integral membrane sensor domain MASE1